MNYTIYQNGSPIMPEMMLDNAPSQVSDRIQSILEKMNKRDEPNPNAIDPALLNQLLSSGAQMSQAASMKMAQQQPSSSGPMIGSMMSQLGKMFTPDAAANSGAAGTVDTSRPLPMDPNLPGGNQSVFNGNNDITPGITPGTTPPFLPTPDTSPSSMVNSIFGKMKNSPIAQMTSDPSGYFYSTPIGRMVSDPAQYLSKTPIGNMYEGANKLYGKFNDPFTRTEMLQSLISGLGSMKSGLSSLGSGAMSGLSALGSGIGSGAGALGSGAAAGAGALASGASSILPYLAMI